MPLHFVTMEIQTLRNPALIGNDKRPGFMYQRRMTFTVPLRPFRPARAALQALFIASALLLPGCQAQKTAPPPQAQSAQPQAVRRPATIEEEKAMLEAEKQELVGDYSENLDRIQQINARIIEINILLSQGARSN